MNPAIFEPRPMPDHNAWPIFVIPGDDITPGPTDLAYLLEKPAGAKGFIQIADGHLVIGDGLRWRIWGQNLTARVCLPSMNHAPLIARHLAKYGINCLRLHFMDLRWPNGLIMRSHQPAALRKTGDKPVRSQSENTRSLDPEALTRLDYFVACCKENGIYVDLNLNVARPFTTADGVVQAEWIGYAKALTYFNARLIELQKEYATHLLTHVNPFTGNAYTDEPAVALVELVNENSLLESWLCNRLIGEQTEPCGTWTDIPPYYATELDNRWNAWLAQRYPTRQVLFAAWQGDLAETEDATQGSVRRLRKSDFAAASYGRFADESAFYAGIERSWFEDMTTYLKDNLGVKQIILGASDHNQGLNNPLHLENLARMGITDGHFYWQHPEFPDRDGLLKDWFIGNTPMVDDADRNVIARVARSKVKGLPYLVSETNCPFPNDFAAGFITILAAYGRFQDWDGIFLYTYNETQSDDAPLEGAIRSFFSIANDPIKMAETATAGLAFLRGDVQTARQTIERHIQRATLIESQRTPLDATPYLVPYLSGRLALTHGLAIASFDAAENAPQPGKIMLDETNILSDTGELNWQALPGNGRVFVDTPSWQAVIGRVGEMATQNLVTNHATPYAVIQIISLDDQTLAQSGKILLLTTARAANTDMSWQDVSRRSLGEAFGQTPTRIEPVTGLITLRGLENAQQVYLQPLDGLGQPYGEAQSLTRSPAGWLIRLEDFPASVWYLIRVER